jgi:hypothetical protein
MDRRPYPWKCTGDKQTSLPQPSVQDRITHIFEAIPLRAKEMAREQAITELLHLEFCQHAKELAADLFMDMAKSSPYVGLKSDGGDHKDTLLYRFCNMPMYWLSINMRNCLTQQEKTLLPILSANSMRIEKKPWPEE